MKKITCFAFMLLMLSTTFAQKRNWEWTFGSGSALSFATGVPVAYNCSINTTEGCASICDTSGKLLFYTDGTSVYDSTNAIMPNGTGLFGGALSAQSALIVPSISNAQQYYLFTVSNWTDIPTELMYSIVDMTLNGGQGDITSVKNIILNATAREQLTAAPHANGQDVWIMVHEPNNTNFCAYLLSASGIDTVPVISAVGMSYNGSNRYGSLRFSHDCTKLVSALGGASTGETVQLFDFNNATGVVSNPLTLATATNMPTAYSSEFSPDDGKLYLTGWNYTFYVYQFDMNAANILASMTDIVPWALSPVNWVQLAPDGKIYLTHQVSYVAAINFPNNPGLTCGYVDSAVALTGGAGICMPNFYNYECVLTTSIAESNEDTPWTLHPNPFNDKLNINGINGESEIILFDIASRKLLQEQFTNSVLLNTEQLAQGVYIYEVRSSNGLYKKGKVVKD